MGVLAGLGAGAGILTGWWLSYPLSGYTIQKNRRAWAVVIGAALGAFLGGSIGVYRVESEFGGPDGARNVYVYLAFPRVRLYSYWARRSLFWGGFGDDCKGTLLGIALGTVVGVAVASGRVMLLRQGSASTGSSVAGEQTAGSGRLARPFLSAVVTSLALGRTYCHGQADVETVQGMRKAVFEARGPREAGAAYEALFRQVGPEGLRDLKCDEDVGIALQAAWRIVEEQGAHPEESFSPTAVHRFLGFVEGKTGCRVPGWWEHALLSAKVGKQPHLAYYPASGDFSYQVKDLGIRAEESVSVSKDGVLATINAGKKRFTLPVRMLEEASTHHRDTLAVHIGDSRAYFAFHDRNGRSYVLFCVDALTSRKRWTAEVWGSGRRAAPAVGRHDVSVSERGGRVFVFGQETHGMYLEAFEAETGKNLFRFRTSLPFPE
jgi:hypothetical protein